MNKILLFVGHDMDLTDSVRESLFTIEYDSIFYTKDSNINAFDVEWFRKNIYPEERSKFTNVYNKYKELKNLNKRIIKLKKI
jgi:hypothetical protein